MRSPIARFYARQSFYTLTNDVPIDLDFSWFVGPRQSELAI
jgi:hypothetical protein